MLEHFEIERRELHHNAGGQIAGIEWKIATPEAGTAADGRRNIPDRDEVAHLIDGDINDRTPPTLHGLGLFSVEALTLAVLQRKSRVEVCAHQIVLKLGGLIERIDELFAR